MFKKILIGVAFVIGAVLIYAATQPDTFRVERTATIKAPPDKIVALITDLRKQQAWSPWEKKDPEMKRMYSGAASGKGAIYEWHGNHNIGQGRMEITESSASRVELKMDFLEPFEAHHIAEFVLVPESDATRVTWAMYGSNPYYAKVMHLFFNMDKMIGNEFETGLANLKALAEK